MKKLVIFGTGGFGREVLELVHDVNRSPCGPTWDIVGFLDDAESQQGRTVHGLPVLGGVRWLEKHGQDVHLALGIGSPPAKRNIALRCRGLVKGFASLRHPTVISGDGVHIGEGSLLAAGTILTTDIVVSDFVTLNLSCTIGHDVKLGPYVTVLPGANISGNVSIGDGADIGTGSAIIQGIEIGEWSVIGAGAVVTKDIPANCTAVGMPASPIKHRPPNWHIPS